MLAIYENSDNTKRDFIKVYADSSDPDVAETWRLLPEAMKAKS